MNELHYPSDLSPKSVRTTCPYCGVGCGVKASYDTNGSFQLTGDEKHPANSGKLCSKGSDLENTLSTENRLLQPMINDESCSWDEAVKTISDNLKQTLNEYGPESVAFYVSGQLLTEDYYVANKFVKGYLGTANIDTNSRLCMASSVAGHKRSFGSDTVPGCYEDLELANLVVLVGSNLAWCHPIVFQRLCKAREDRPNMNIVVVDPRRTATASMADSHLAIQPGSDSILFCGLLKYLKDNHTLNQEYIDSYTVQFDVCLESVQDCTLDYVEQQTGLAQSDIETFYQQFAQTPETVTLYSQGINQSENGTDSVSSIINCHLATGRIGLPGSGPFSITGQPNAMGGREVGGLSNMLASHMNLEDPKHRDCVQRFWGSPHIAQRAGLKAVDLFDAVATQKIRFIWIMATNPADSMPMANSVSQALKNCPFVVVSDVVNHSDTQEFANVRLPSSAWSEKDGTVTNSERYISRQRALRPSTGNAKPDWWQICKVAQQLGFQEAFNYNAPHEIFREHAALSGFENAGSRDFDISLYDDIQRYEYDQLSPFQWPARHQTSENSVRFFSTGGFYTDSGRANFIPVVAKKMPHTCQEFPLTLNTGRIRDQWHTMTRTGDSVKLNTHLAEPFVEINPDDARKNAITDADLVTVTSTNGSVTVRALITDNQQKGSVFIPIHWTNQYASNARVDQLVSPRTDPISGQPALKSEAVSICRTEVKTHGFAISQMPIEFSKQSLYWAKAPCTSGHRYEFASSNSRLLELHRWKVQWENDSSLNTVDLSDEKQGSSKVAFFNDTRLVCLIYLSDTPVVMSRAWGSTLLQQTYPLHQRYSVLAGKARNDEVDIGAIVCSCHMIGVNEIESAIIDQGCETINDVGSCTTAGTNCGSCRGEISALLRNANLRRDRPASHVSDVSTVGSGHLQIENG